jgi:hypothetical protein
MAGWISPRSADTAAARDPSYSTSRRASPRGLGYDYSTTWEATRYRSISGHILQDDPSIREEVSTQGSGAPCHVSFGFFSPDFSGYPCQDFRWTLSQSLRLNLRLGGIFEDLRGQHSRTLGTTREDFKIARISAGVHSSLGMLRLLLRTFDL